MGLCQMKTNSSTRTARRVSSYAIVFTALIYLAPCIFAAEGCTHIRVELNGMIIPNPAIITLIGSRGGTPVIVSVNDGCFRLPKKLIKKSPFEVKFQTNGENVDLIGIEKIRFEEAWTIVLNDTASEELLKDLHAANAKEICIVDFNPGVGDGTSLAQAGCRSTVTAGRRPAH